MLLDFNELEKKYSLGLHVRGVLHVGAHLAEEASDYDDLLDGIPVWWVEANPAVVGKINEVISEYPNQQLIQALVSDTEGGQQVFHVTNYDGMSSSMLSFGTHTEFSPDTVFVHDLSLSTRTIDSLVSQYRMLSVNMLVMDIQGTEGLALAGASELLSHVDFVMLEVNKADVYLGCTKVWDLDDTLLEHGLRRLETHWVGEQGWGDAFYAKVPA